jgi:hypothetical protein
MSGRGIPAYARDAPIAKHRGRATYETPVGV